MGLLENGYRLYLYIVGNYQLDVIVVWVILLLRMSKNMENVDLMICI